ncbi:Citrate lyase subunit beta [Lasiodiplodia theobromae]|uniref:Citrate lyase subunit beta-like protein n=1 Tax=Lasiodiplodia theobromae TaxID=45133 RepID=A0A5N5DJ30_9PEZI|nr:Citrate lyase subunit beta [Lasiodiplodia theobromae]KAB2577906.1 Citrate lyase subunit beta-like protein [Lasiodiplodia theobromae]KAF4538454.1 Citrate lyase subunit beta [Lasiodiplodia theobromae]
MAAPIIRRALLYVPGSSQKMLDKSRGIASVDTVAYDLEDSVTPGKKAEARANLRQLLDQPRVPGIREQAVRINSVDSGYALDDLTEVLKGPNLDALVIPKVNSASDLHFVTDVIRHTLPQRHPSTPSSQEQQQEPLRLIALIESAKALMDLPSICQSTPYLSGLIFAAEDFALDLSLTRTPSLREFLYARSAIVTAARAYNLPSAIDLVCTSFRGDEGLKALQEECADGKKLGFNGKQLIHPSQVDVAQRAFAPGQEETDWAMRVVVADEKADRAGRGAWTLDGKMIDKPVVGKARAVVKKAELCGVDVGTLREKWKGQEPE